MISLFGNMAAILNQASYDQIWQTEYANNNNYYYEYFGAWQI